MPVRPQPEPLAADGFDFDGRVRRPGRLLLKTLLGLVEPSGRLAKRRKVADALEGIASEHLIAYWQGPCLDRLYDAYGGVCAYLSILIDRSTADPTVDHFIPQTHGPWGRLFAYEWGNFRLSALPPNREKGVEAVLDPFAVRVGDFAIEFNGFQVKPGDALAPARRARVDATIETLGLNAPRHRETRARLVSWWETGDISLRQLGRMAPFLHAELVRLGGGPRRRVGAPVVGAEPDRPPRP